MSSLLRSLRAADVRRAAAYDASAAEVPEAHWRRLAKEMNLPAIAYREQVSSTMDVAHGLAEGGAPAGTVVVANRQEAGRGRAGKSWQSDAGAGLWCTLIERPTDARALDVLALRAGLALADALTPLVDGPVQLKWPNDLLVRERKLAGILIEVRWRDGQPEWVALGLGVNRRATAAFPDAACVRSDVSRDVLLTVVIPPLRQASAQTGPLARAECEAWAARDVMRGRHVRAPVEGVVQGISPDGAVLIVDADGIVRASRSGSLVVSDRDDNADAAI